MLETITLVHSLLSIFSSTLHVGGFEWFWVVLGGFLVVFEGFFKGFWGFF